MTAASLPLTAALVGLTVVSYTLARRVALHRPHPLLNPVLLSAGATILVLQLSGLGFDPYRPAQEVLGWLLGPATVALAIPVYNQRARLRAVLLPFVCGVLCGTLTTMATVLALAALGRLDGPVLLALAFKSVTAAVGVELARLHGGDPSLTAVFVVVTGMIGASLGPWVLTRCGITDPVARGIALGTISHAQGTAVALAEHETAGALASLAIIGAAISTALVTPVYLPLLLRLLHV